jgi:hypothetical protein
MKALEGFTMCHAPINLEGINTQNYLIKKISQIFSTAAVAKKEQQLQKNVSKANDDDFSNWCGEITRKVMTFVMCNG